MAGILRVESGKGGRLQSGGDVVELLNNYLFHQRLQTVTTSRFTELVTILTLEWFISNVLWAGVKTPGFHPTESETENDWLA